MNKGTEYAEMKVKADVVKQIKHDWDHRDKMNLIISYSMIIVVIALALVK